jgi:hypothetical protein
MTTQKKWRRLCGLSMHMCARACVRTTAVTCRGRRPCCPQSRVWRRRQDDRVKRIKSEKTPEMKKVGDVMCEHDDSVVKSRHADRDSPRRTAPCGGGAVTRVPRRVLVEDGSTHGMCARARWQKVCSPVSRHDSALAKVFAVEVGCQVHRWHGVPGLTRVLPAVVVSCAREGEGSERHHWLLSVEGDARLFVASARGREGHVCQRMYVCVCAYPCVRVSVHSV